VTARLTPSLIRALYTETLSLEFGIRLPIEAAYFESAKVMIYSLMKGTPEAERVMLCAFPEDGELWFVKRTVEIEI
jgi:hypothetical protein